MAASISQVKIAPKFLQSSTSKPKVGFSSAIAPLRVKNQQSFRVLKNEQISFKLRCAKEASSLSETEKILMEDNELNMEQELIGMRDLCGKCEGIGGIVELLECLETEAIMGEDEGRDPNDYNRRAQIFDKSSRVFQALKQTASADQA